MPVQKSLEIYWRYHIHWFGLLLWHINRFRLFNAKYFLYIYIEYMIFKQILETIKKKAWAHFLNTVKCFHSFLMQIIQFTINYLPENR